MQQHLKLFLPVLSILVTMPLTPHLYRRSAGVDEIKRIIWHLRMVAQWYLNAIWRKCGRPHASPKMCTALWKPTVKANPHVSACHALGFQIHELNNIASPPVLPMVCHIIDKKLDNQLSQYENRFDECYCLFTSIIRKQENLLGQVWIMKTCLIANE